MDIEDYEEEIDSNQQFIEDNINKVPTLSNIEKKQALLKINKSIKEMEGNAKAYKQKIFEVAMPKAQEDEFKSKQQKYVDLISDYKEQVKKLQMNLDGPSEEKEESDDIIFTNGKIDYAKNTSEQVIQHGLNTQNKGINVAERLVGRTDEMNKMADENIEELDRQEDVILRINDANMEIESDMKRAKKYIKYFARTYMQDKCIIVLIFLVCVAILGVFIVSVMGKK